MVKRNPHLAKLHAGYLFPEITKRKQAFLLENPAAKLISLGIGDTTEPLPLSIAQPMAESAQALGTVKGYSGYGPDQGEPLLRQLLAAQVYHQRVKPDEIFISDGAKCDIGRLQVLFGSQATIAVQDPSYPVYVDSSVILGQTQAYDPAAQQYKGITYLKCTPENDFFPSFTHIPRTDLIYFCSPNNPTGAVATRAQLEALVALARKQRSIIIYDAAYACYIQQPDLPRSIFEIEGAEEVAIEVGSFSKMIGFTGVRLAWSVVPHALQFEDKQAVHRDWHRLMTTFFNGASNIAQAGGIATLQPEGQAAMQQLIHFYKTNALLLREVFEKHNYPVYGGVHAPYLWVQFPGLKSWEVFERLLQKSHLVSTPGIGFGPAGEGFVRFSAFGQRAHIEEAVNRLQRDLPALKD